MASINGLLPSPSPPPSPRGCSDPSCPGPIDCRVLLGGWWRLSDPTPCVPLPLQALSSYDSCRLNAQKGSCCRHRKLCLPRERNPQLAAGGGRSAHRQAGFGSSLLLVGSLPWGMPCLFKMLFKAPARLVHPCGRTVGEQ